MNPMVSRRSFLCAAAAAACAPVLGQIADAGTKHVLLRSSWQTVNIGDIAHTPGILRLLEEHLPGVRVTLWPNKLDRGVDRLLKGAFPKLELAEEEGAQGRAMRECDFMLHGSGPAVVGHRELRRWQEETGKPFGVYGVTIERVDERMRELLSKAAFVFCRDTDSLRYLREESGVKGPVTGFTPDATFALHIRDDARAEAYLRQAGLEKGKFLCAVPRLRYTPYPHIEEPERSRRLKVNDEFAEADHAKLREAMVAWVRGTGMKVLCCPEMTYEVELLGPLLVDPLPEDVKKQVVRRESYWMTDEAAGVYARARAIASFEMHSPIIAVANGTPAVHLRQPTDTRKGQMWRDVGLGEWLFEIERTEGREVAEALLKIHGDDPAARRKVAEANGFVGERHRETMKTVAAALERRT